MCSLPSQCLLSSWNWSYNHRRKSDWVNEVQKGREGENGDKQGHTDQHLKAGREL